MAETSTSDPRPWTAEFVEPTTTSTVPKYNLKPQAFTVEAVETMMSLRTSMPQRSATTKSRKEQWAMSMSQVQTLTTEQPEPVQGRTQFIQVRTPTPPAAATLNCAPPPMLTIACVLLRRAGMRIAILPLATRTTDHAHALTPLRVRAQVEYSTSLFTVGMLMRV